MADDIKIAMACMKISNNNTSNNLNEKLLPSAITNYSVCNQTLIALASPDSTIHDYDNQVLYVMVDMYEEDYAKPNCTQCVICKDNFVLPKITKCGHIFCYPCIMGYMVACESTHLVKCPLCSRWIHAPDLKSLIWRNIKRLNVGDKIKFHLYRYNTETNSAERMRENPDKTTSARRKSSNNQTPSRHTFDYLWNHLQHRGNGEIFVDQTQHNFILPDNNIYFVARDFTACTLFDIEKSIIVDRINDPSTSTEEMVSLLACSDHYNDFMDRLMKQIETFAEEVVNTPTSINAATIHNKSPINNSASNENRCSSAKTLYVNKKNNDANNDSTTFVTAATTNTTTTTDTHEGSLAKRTVSNIPIFPLVKPEFVKTPRDLKNRSKPINENDYRFKKYLFFYKNETYFNTYMASVNCGQIVDYLMENKCVFDDQLRLPITVEGVLLHVENYEPESVLLADSIWKYCSSMVKFLGFCCVHLNHPYEFEVPQVDAIQFKCSNKSQRVDERTTSSVNNSSITGEDIQTSWENFNLHPIRNATPAQYQSNPFNFNVTTTVQSPLNGEYPDLQSYYYDYFGNKTDDFPSFD